MTTYIHKTTGASAELISEDQQQVTLRDLATGEEKGLNRLTFKRWWKAETPETLETETPETSETETPEAPDIMSMSEITKKLEDLFDFLNTQYFEGALPKTVITVQSTPKAYGHCTNGKVWGAKGEFQFYEINLGAEFLNRPSASTAATLLHEMVHLYCRENDIKETCQGVRYHTKVFKAEAEARDLNIEYHRSIGYSITSPTEALIDNLEAAGFEDIPFARHNLGDGKAAPKRKKSHKYECPECQQSFRTTAELNLTCSNCDEPMEKLA